MREGSRMGAWGRVTATLLAAWCAAQLCLWLHTPIPWMLGPLIVTALASMSGLPTRSSGWLRNAGQWVIGAALGLYFTPQVSATRGSSRKFIGSKKDRPNGRSGSG